MAGRRAATKADSSPGPGAYDAKQSSGSPSYGLGTGQRKTFSAPNTPGPGAYSPRYLGDSSPQWGIGTQSRSRAGGVSKLDVPGPGTYTLPSRLQESPQYSMGSRGEQKRKDNSPGPGAYNPRYPERDAGKYSFGVKTAASRPGGTTPGPGAYNMIGDIASPKSPQWTFGSQVRGKSYSTSLPGPGQYNPESSPRRRPPAWRYELTISEHLDRLRSVSLRPLCTWAALVRVHKQLFDLIGIAASSLTATTRSPTPRTPYPTAYPLFPSLVRTK
ncbi:hypothetical protein NCLIV_018270 [Neospora caninum Liverpool]|uniref:H-SHIPPO 1, putative n=1 Tax=Neospora caninum (strain Liverpool) TaxID=572307 RepID=F0VE93_NEOCL|nr:hypothetical protein NCLIV_018270 [Neospora caninum Liverpool]CBZ52037.1 hypothetical protein NCLIV_018270 [Neospora caninum Liverpool]CEL65998.1 TPA: H-SHIPPO 1, putative [Neospora caninum Liverpool]|eukprot:XP_003882069.1 hypothetical protein NCLIV_018270 [Neospora caninum Liverpool]